MSIEACLSVTKITWNKVSLNNKGCCICNIFTIAANKQIYFGLWVKFVCVYVCVFGPAVCRFSGIRSCYSNPRRRAKLCCISHPSEKESSEKERKRVIDGNRGLKEKQSNSPFICNEDLCCVGVRKSSSIPAEWAEIWCFSDYIYMHLYMRVFAWLCTCFLVPCKCVFSLRFV